MQVLQLTLAISWILVDSTCVASTSHTRILMNFLQKKYSRLSKSLYSMNRILSESIMDRYYKEPEPRIPPSFPSTYSDGDCVLNGAGIYGMSSQREIPLVFSYELEIKSNGRDKIESDIIPLLEQAVGADLAAGLGVCRIRLQQKDQIVKNDSGSRKLFHMNFQRQLQSVFGLGLLPVDQINQNRACQYSFSENSSCLVVDGVMSLYIPNDYSTFDVNAIVTTSLDEIKMSMDEGKYNAGVQGDIIRVSYAGSSTLPSELSEDGSTEAPVSRPTDSQKAYGYVIIASCAVLAVVVVILMRRRNRDSRISHVESGDVVKETSKQIPDLEISVTDTTDISTIGSPSYTSSKDDSSSSSTVGSSKVSQPQIPAPLLGGEEDDEKSYQDDEMLFNS